MGAERRALVMAAVAAGLMISGAAVTVMPNSTPAVAAYISAVKPVVTTPVTSVYAEQPRPILVVPTTAAMLHTEHAHHVAVVAAATTHAAMVIRPAVVATVTTSVATSAPTTPDPTPISTTPSPTPTPTPTPTKTQTPPPSGRIGASLLNKALTMQGVPYVYGGDTPSGFDCSGLVYWAALQLWISNMPRDTYEMLAQGVSSGLLVPTSNPSYGDLAFFGSGHVEFYVHTGETFGAQSPGTVVGYHSYGYGYVPTMFFKVALCCTKKSA